MKTTAQGLAAEAAVASLLKKQKYDILDQNWRTRSCEIDIVARKSKVVYFVEVKFRSQAAQGDGFEYVTPRKLSQMTYAANMWCQQHDYSGDYRLMAAAVSGEDLENISLVEV